MVHFSTQHHIHLINNSILSSACDKKHDKGKTRIVIYYKKKLPYIGKTFLMPNICHLHRESAISTVEYYGSILRICGEKPSLDKVNKYLNKGGARHLYIFKEKIKRKQS